MSRGPVRYVLDANVFMQARRRYYAFEIAPTFWQALIEKARNNLVMSIDRVKMEIDKGKDDLADWANSDFRSWFFSTADSDVIDAYAEIIQWASDQSQFTGAAKAEFASGDNADALLVAYALTKGCVVVTHEQFDSGIKRKIPIPNVCRTFGVPYVDTFQMLRELGVRL